MRSRGSGNSNAMSPSDAGAANASPRPWTNRLATNMAGLMAAPQVAEATAKMATPTMNIRRRPKMSARRPPRSRKPPAINT